MILTITSTMQKILKDILRPSKEIESKFIVAIM